MTTLFERTKTVLFTFGISRYAWLKLFVLAMGLRMSGGIEGFKKLTRTIITVKDDRAELVLDLRAKGNDAVGHTIGEVTKYLFPIEKGGIRVPDVAATIISSAVAGLTTSAPGLWGVSAAALTGIMTGYGAVLGSYLGFKFGNFTGKYSDFPLQSEDGVSSEGFYTYARKTVNDQSYKSLNSFFQAFYFYSIGLTAGAFMTYHAVKPGIDKIFEHAAGNHHTISPTPTRPVTGGIMTRDNLVFLSPPAQ